MCRGRFDKLLDQEVNWHPYTEYLSQLPTNCRSRAAQNMWLYCGPLICFWIVEWHAPERVLRQLGYSQTIPLPPRFHDELHDIKHEPNSNSDWGVVHEEYVNMWMVRHTHVITPPEENWNEFMHATYMAWYNEQGMRTVFYMSSTVAGVYDPISEPVPDDHSSQMYTHRLDRAQHTVRLILYILRCCLN